MKKVLLIQDRIMHYRVPVFNALAEKVDLTVLYSFEELPDGIKFKTLHVPHFKLRYKIHKKNLCRIANRYDVVIVMMDFSYLYVRLLSKKRRKYKLIYWGIGVSAGYNIRYDSDSLQVDTSYKRVKKADAVGFYCSYPIEKYVKMGIEKEKMFVFNNTVKVLPVDEREKDLILFIGTLYKQKKIDVLLENYFRAYNKNKNVPTLAIIGDGDERASIGSWISEKGLNGKILLAGAVYNEAELASYFSRSIMCISPDQAGLSVLKSMGYGVPFITHKDAITGGEIFNIENGVNGVLLNSFDDIEGLILESADNPEKFFDMGEKAKKHYEENRSVEKMVDGFMEAIGFVSE